MKLFNIKFALIILALGIFLEADGKDTAMTIDLKGKIMPESDITLTVSEILKEIPKNDVKIILPSGKYYLTPQLASGKYLTVTNHDNGYKHIAFDLEGFSNLEIIGNGTEPCI